MTDVALASSYGIGPITEAEQEDGGWTLYQEWQKTPVTDVSADDCMAELQKRLIALREKAETPAEQEYIENLLFLAAKAHYKFNPQALPPSAVMRFMIERKS